MKETTLLIIQIVVSLGLVGVVIWFLFNIYRGEFKATLVFLIVFLIYCFFTFVYKENTSNDYKEKIITTFKEGGNIECSKSEFSDSYFINKENWKIKDFGFINKNSKLFYFSDCSIIK